MNRVVSTKSELLTVIQNARDAHQTFLDSLTDAQRNATGTFDYKDWTAKDVIAHCNLWMEQSHNRMTKIQNGQMPDVLDNDGEQKLNAEHYEQWRDRSWAEVLADTERLFNLLSEDLTPFSDEDLKRTGYYPQSDRTIYQLYMGNIAAHPQLHYTDYYLLRGDLAHAEAVQQKAMQNAKLFSDLYSQGVGEYNLACFYARTNQAERALALLPGALRLAPALTDWSKEDPDLVSLHDIPEYAALYVN